MLGDENLRVGGVWRDWWLVVFVGVTMVSQYCSSRPSSMMVYLVNVSEVMLSIIARSVTHGALLMVVTES